jgi:excisionase family DNA binding protein
MNTEHEYYSINEICKNFSISQSTLYKMIKDGRIKAYKLGRCWKVPRAEFLRALYEHS